MVRNLSAMQEVWVQSLGREDPLEKEMATHSSILAWRIPSTERSLVDCSPWGCKESDMTQQTSKLSKTKKISEFLRRHKRPQTAKALEKEKWIWRDQYPRLQIYYKATVNKTVPYWHKQNTDHCNRIESLEIDSCTYSQFFL